MKPTATLTLTGAIRSDGDRKMVETFLKRDLSTYFAEVKIAWGKADCDAKGVDILVDSSGTLGGETQAAIRGLIRQRVGMYGHPDVEFKMPESPPAGEPETAVAPAA